LLGRRLFTPIAGPKPYPNPDGGTKERVPAHQQTRRHGTPKHENEESAIRQIRRQDHWQRGIHKPEQLCTDPKILGFQFGEFSED
jgi:hypothetical protein